MSIRKNVLRILTIPERIRNFTLFIIFRFDKWHISPSGNRIYPSAIICHVKKLYSPDRICEIGCGLGDIISKLDGKYMVGLDRDNNVLRAASFLHTKNKALHFKRFDFPVSKLEERYDLIIAVNWLHGVDEETIKNIFSKYFINNLNDNGYLIVDTVDNVKYKYSHNFAEYFSGLDCTITLVGEFPGGRIILSIKKLSSV